MINSLEAKATASQAGREKVANPASKSFYLKEKKQREGKVKVINAG